MNSNPTVSIVVPTKNEGDDLEYTIHHLLANSSSHEFEIIVIDDLSSDGSGADAAIRYVSHPAVTVVRAEEWLGIGGARRLGASLAQGDVIAQVDSHTFCPDGWLAPLVEPLRWADVAVVQATIRSMAAEGLTEGDTPIPSSESPPGVGMTLNGFSMEGKWIPYSNRPAGPFEIPIAACGIHATSRVSLDAIGGYDDGMLPPFGGEQEELSIRAWLMGYRVMSVPGCEVWHKYRDSAAGNPVPYEMPLYSRYHNYLRVALLHFSWERIGETVKHYMGKPEFDRTFEELMLSDVLERRQWLETMRVRDDDWWVSKFGVTL